MLIPANLAIGALIGAAASYVYKDDAAKETLSNLGGKVKSGFDSTLSLFKKPVTGAEESMVAEHDATGVEEADVVAEEKSDKA